MTQTRHVTCETPAHADHERELLRASERVAKLEAALKTIAETPCDANPNMLASSCGCCMHDRMIARAALAGVE